MSCCTMNEHANKKLSPKSGQHEIYLNRLQNQRNEVLATTQQTIERLEYSIQQRLDIEINLSFRLNTAELELQTKNDHIKTLQTEINSLLTAETLEKRTQKNISQIKSLSTKNEKLQESQFHLALAEASNKVKALKKKYTNKISRQKALSDMREDKLSTELVSLRKRISKFQTTVKNVNKLRKTDVTKYNKKISDIMKEVKTMKQAVSKSQQSQKAAIKLTKENEVLIQKLISKDALLNESRQLLSKEKGVNDELKIEMKMMMMRNENKIQEQANAYQRTMLNNYTEQKETSKLMERLQILADEKMMFIDNLADSIAEVVV